MTNILFFPCNGHGVVASMQTINTLGIAMPNLQINTLSTNCDSGGATGNDRIINQQLFSNNLSYQGWKNLALGDYMKLLMGFIKHKFTVTADNKTDIQVDKWISFDQRLLASSTRNNNQGELLEQMASFFEGIGISLEGVLKSVGINLGQLNQYVEDYLEVLESLKNDSQAPELKDETDRGQTVWFYLLINFLYNSCNQDFSEINLIWQRLGVIYPNVNLGVIGSEAHHLSYTDCAGKVYLEEDEFDNRSDVSSPLDMASSRLYDVTNSSSNANNKALKLELDSETILKIQSADQIVIPLGSHETVYAYIDEYQDYLKSKKIILIMNSDMSKGQKSEYNQLLHLLNEIKLEELVIIGHPSEINSEMKLPENAMIKYVGHDTKGMLRTDTLNSEIIKQILTNIPIEANLDTNLESVSRELKNARLGSHLNILKPFLKHPKNSQESFRQFAMY